MKRGGGVWWTSWSAGAQRFRYQAKDKPKGGEATVAADMTDVDKCSCSASEGNTRRGGDEIREGVEHQKLRSGASGRGIWWRMECFERT